MGSLLSVGSGGLFWDVAYVCVEIWVGFGLIGVDSFPVGFDIEDLGGNIFFAKFEAFDMVVEVEGGDTGSCG